MAGRPREFDRDEALKKARNLFWQYGFEGTSMADLTQALNIASARIYAAFGSKEALFREAVEQYQLEKGSFASVALAQNSDARAAIEQVLRGAIDVYTDKFMGCMVVSSAVNYSQNHHNIAQWLTDMRNERTDLIKSYLKQAKCDGTIVPNFNETAFADFCCTALCGFSVQARDGVDTKRLNAIVDLIMKAYDSEAQPKI